MSNLGPFDLLLSMARFGGLGATARAHGITERAALARLHGLQRRMGVALLEGSPRGPRLTPQGALVADWARAAFDTAAALEAGIAALRPGTGDRLPVAAGATAAECLLPRWLAALHRTEPATAVELTTGRSEDVAAAVLNGRAELGVIEGLVLPEGLLARTVARDALTVVVAPGHPWARRPSGIAPHELAVTPLVSTEHGTDVRRFLEQALVRQVGTRLAPPVVELPSTTAVTAAVAEGVGPAVLSSLAVAGEIAAGTLQAVPVRGRALTRELRLVHLTGRPLVGVARELATLAVGTRGAASGAGPAGVATRTAPADPAQRGHRGAVGGAAAGPDALGIAAEQAALRRLAALVDHGQSPCEVFDVVAAEVGRLLEADYTLLSRYGARGTATVVGAWSGTGVDVPAPVGTRVELGGRDSHALVFRTGRAVRVDDYRGAPGQFAEIARERGVSSTVGVPISLDGRVWGVMAISFTRGHSPPPQAEARLGGFTELVATAIANAQARLELRGFAEEQAALRRVATLVASGAPPEEVFDVVAAEVGRLLEVDFTVLSRHEPDGTQVSLGVWSRGSDVEPFPVGTRMALGGRNVTSLVVETGRPARFDYFAGSGPIGEAALGWGFRSGCGAPIGVEGRLWGVMAAVAAGELPADTEERLVGFTELVATAIANAEARAALTASRARVVTAADQARRRIERDLHDGAQQRVVLMELQLRAARAAVPAGADELAALLDELTADASGALDELRELARGIHPAVLAEGGLPSALAALARRSTVPVRLDVRVDPRPPEYVEIAAYYLVAEALTNVAKHAHATAVHVEVDRVDRGYGAVLRVLVRDDGRGGAALGGGSGLVGLKDRVEAVGGRLDVQSPEGEGTTVRAEIPFDAAPA